MEEAGGVRELMGGPNPLFERRHRVVVELVPLSLFSPPRYPPSDGEGEGGWLVSLRFYGAFSTRGRGMGKTGGGRDLSSRGKRRPPYAGTVPQEEEEEGPASNNSARFPPILRQRRRNTFAPRRYFGATDLLFSLYASFLHSTRT